MSENGQPLLVQVPGRDPEVVRIRGEGPFPLGRAPENSVVVNDSAVSRKHAEILVRADGYWIQDLKSKNGTKVNGTLIESPIRLKSGDRIDIGPCQIHFDRERGPGSSARIADTKAPGTVHAVPLADIVGATQSPANIKAITATGASPQRMAQFFEGMERLGPALLAHKPMAELFQFIVDLTSDVLHSDRTVLILRGEDGVELIPKATKQRGASTGEILVSRSIARRAIDDRTAILTSDAQSDERFKGHESVIRQRINSAMCVPLWHEDEVLGVLYVDNVAAPIPYEHSDLLILIHIGHLAAVKILETKSLEELEGQREMQRELKRAANLQQSLLPTEPLLSPPYRIAGKNIPSSDVGGDYFDFINGDAPVLTVGLGDVAGKGMPAALLMTNLSASVRAHVESESRLPLVMARLNRSIHHAVRGGDRFITLFLIAFDRKSGDATYVNAGHNPPYLVHPSGETETLTVGGLLLGMFPDAVYESAVVRMGPGDALVLYSDGVTEARDDEGEEFGEERLVSFLKENRAMDPERLVESLIRAVHDFSKDGKPGDDVTVAVIRRD